MTLFRVGLPIHNPPHAVLHWHRYQESETDFGDHGVSFGKVQNNKLVGGGVKRVINRMGLKWVLYPALR